MEVMMEEDAGTELRTPRTSEAAGEASQDVPPRDGDDISTPLLGTATVVAEQKKSKQKKKMKGQGAGEIPARRLSTSSRYHNEIGPTIDPMPPLATLLRQATERRIREGCLSGSWIAENLPPHSYISDLLTPGSVPAITPVDDRVSLTHAELRELIWRVDDSDLKSGGVLQYGARIGVAVPNGPELMAVLLAVMERHTAVPLNPATTAQEMHAELRATGVVALIFQRETETEEVMRKLCGKLGIVPLMITKDPVRGAMFSLAGDPYRADVPTTSDRGAGDWESGYNGATPRSTAALGGETVDPRRTALVLHTSGSTGKKKVVPISNHQLVLGAVAIAASTGLTRDDVCLNFMPLFHVGGICRNLLAPLFAGGSTVAMPFFDIDDFWTVAVEKKCTWYYGAPTMHLLLVNSAQAMDGGPPVTKIRFVANAAGPLLPSVAIQIREVFPGAAVLTSYGMTECMPITCPPPGYALERAGSSGQAICPEVAIVDDNGERVSNGRVAHIVVRGSIVTKGYESDLQATSDSFFPGGWFKTGDMGWMDADGYLYVTGRTKEVINRGGEIISPAEIEEALLPHPGVSDVVAISVPHATLQETVGVVVVPTKGIQVPGLRQLCQHVSNRLPPAKWPQLLVLVEKIPRLGATGKISRSAIAKSLDLVEIHDGMSELDVTFEADLTVNTGRKEIATRGEATDRVAAALAEAPGVEDTAAVVDTTGSNAIIGAVTPADADAVKVMNYATRVLPGFLEPKDVIVLDVIPHTADGRVDSQALLALWKGKAAAKNKLTPLTTNELAVREAMSENLKVDARTIGKEDDFFQIGGSSIIAGQFAADIRRKLGSAITGADIFRYRTVQQIAAKIQKESEASGSDGPTTGMEGGAEKGHGKMANKPLGPMEWTQHFSPTSISSLFIQSLPLLVFHPLQKILRWTIFLNTWAFCIHCLHPSVNFVHHISNHTFIAYIVRLAGVDPENQHFHHLRLVAFFAALFITAVVSTVIFPLLAAAVKWSVLGKLRPGLHPLWGQYYLRWWLATKALEVSGPGIFAFNEGLYRFFLRLLGCKIGYGAKVGRLVRICDFDMITIHINATVDDYAHVRAAEVRRGALRVAPVYIGANATVCTHAVVGPGGIVPAGATLGPYMSWRELDVGARGAAAQMEEHRKLARMRQEQPSTAWTFAVWPLLLLTEMIVWVPWVIVFVLLIRSQGLQVPGEEGFKQSGHHKHKQEELAFLDSPGAYIKNWLGHYTGADEVQNDANPSSPIFIDGIDSRMAAPTSRHLLTMSHHGHRYPNLIVERGEYMRTREPQTSAARLGQSHAHNLGNLRNDWANSGFTIAPNSMSDSNANSWAVLSNSPPPPPPGPIEVDEEGGGTIPSGGFVHSFYYGDPLFEKLDAMTWKDCITWFMDPFRLAVIFSARIGHAIFGPLLQMSVIILIKRLVVGKFHPGPLPRTYAAREWELTRRWIMNKLLPKGDFRGAIAVLGKHYEYTSFIYRMLGAKIGKRVFWPGSGVFVADGMFDLLEVEDDVVWGSRSLVFPSDTIGALPVKIGKGGNVSDRCVLYAGTTLLEDACLGSGSVSQRKSKFEVGSIWVGARNGACVQLDPGTKTQPGKDGAVGREAKPFGRAVYQGKATYFLPPWQIMPLIFSLVIALRTMYQVIPIWVSWYVVAVITWDLGNNFWTEMPEWRYLVFLVFVYLWVHMMHTVMRFIFDTGIKWTIIGRREPGLYPWDRSSYCFRWKMFEMLCSDTLHDTRLLGGSAFLPFFYNIMGAKIGRRVCLYPTGADPPMVEPDLVIIEDLACINFAHIICHTNTLGSFALNHIIIKSGAALGTESRIMGGVVIGKDAVLLEHTMAMVGDEVETETIWQGWPVHTIIQGEDTNSDGAKDQRNAAAMSSESPRKGDGGSSGGAANFGNKPIGMSAHPSYGLV